MRRWTNPQEEGGLGAVSGSYPPPPRFALVAPVSGGQSVGRVRPLLHATRCTEGGGDCREDGDYYVEDLTPESVVVESSHFV